MKKKNIIIILLLLAIASLAVINHFVHKVDVKNLFEGKEVSYAITKTIKTQQAINEELEGYLNDENFTLENPKVILNPYKISPLSAIVIFSTNNKESYKVYINSVLFTNMESSKKHSIPIYGLLAETENVIKLVSSNNKEKEIIIKTDKANDINKMEVNVSKGTLNDELYFFAGPMKTGASAYDKKGNLRWYLTERYTMDFEWLDNGHFLVGINEGSVHDRKIGFVEMDYLGKIYNYYVSQNGYEFEFQILSNGNYMMAGGNDAIFYSHPYVYEINNKTGKKESYIDIYDIFTKIDPDINTAKLNWTIIRNAFSYNEETDELVVSLRGLNAVVCFDYTKKELKWIFANPGFFSEKFDKYMVTLESGRYPKGQHSISFTKEGYIGFINNDYDRINGYEAGGKDLVSDWEGIYETAEIYKIEDKKATLVWSFGDNMDIFGQLYGSFTELENTRLVNFGFVMNNDYRYKKGATLSESESTTKYSHALIYEVDKEKNILFKATIADAKYRAFKHSLYNETTMNTDVSKLKIMNTINKTKLDKVYTKDIIEDLIEAKQFENTFIFTKNVIETNYVFNKTDKINVILVGEKNTSYIFEYKNENKTHINLYNINLKGKYSVYLVINGVYYDTNLISDFE